MKRITRLSILLLFGVFLTPSYAGNPVPSLPPEPIQISYNGIVQIGKFELETPIFTVPNDRLLVIETISLEAFRLSKGPFVSDFYIATELNGSGDSYWVKDQYNKAIELNSKYAKANDNRGLAYAGKSQYDQVISDCTKAIELKPKFAKAYYNRGLAWKMKGDFDQALADAKKALSLKPTNKLLQSFVTELESDIKRKE